MTSCIDIGNGVLHSIHRSETGEEPGERPSGSRSIVVSQPCN